MADDPYRWVSVREAARRIPRRRDAAVDLMRRAGIIQRLDGREVVWLADLAAIDDDSVDQRRRQRGQVEAPSRGTLPRASLRPVS